MRLAGQEVQSRTADADLLAGCRHTTSGAESRSAWHTRLIAIGLLDRTPIGLFDRTEFLEPRTSVIIESMSRISA
jgi:hypothetical protein